MTSRAYKLSEDLPLVTIGVAVFNGGDDLVVALESLLAQDYPRIEILLCDDGSTDGSFEYCKEVVRRDPRCRLMRNSERLGIVGNYNRLIAEARGKYFLHADQDDRRSPTFVSRCVEVLERDPDAVLCHSHTGVVWPGIGGRLYHINTLDSLDGVRPVLSRYRRFLHHYSDTLIYGLVRLEALRSSRGWPQGLGSAARLVSRLVLVGPFRQIEEVLFWYTGKGRASRPNVTDEYARHFGGRRPPRFYRPFLGVAWSQSLGILESKRSMREQLALLLVLWAHVGSINLVKFIYRFLARVSRNRLPCSFTRICAEFVSSTRDFRFIDQDDAADVYSRVSPLLGSAGTER